MTIVEFWNSISSLNWQIFLTIVLVNWYFYRRLKKNMETLDERMFYLATGQSLADVIKNEKLNKKE